MSSDYITRLRSELLRAGASKQARWRWARVARGLRPLAAAAAVALVAVAVVLALPDRGNDETPVAQPAGTLRLTYRVERPGAAEQAAQVIRERLAAAGMDDAGVTVSSDGRLTITAPAGARADVTALAQRGRLAIYDWAHSVLGARGAAQDVQVAGVTRAEAEARAAGRPDVRIVHDQVHAPDRWLALAGEPAMNNADIESAASAVDQAAQDPIVAIEFTAGGQTAFHALTRELAHRGSARAADGADYFDAVQHFLIVIDDQIVSVPYIGFREAPDGIDGSGGAQIQGGLTARTASRMAAILTAGPLPAELVLASEATSDG